MANEADTKVFRSSAVRFGRTVSSISLSRKAASYRPRPRLRSQTTMSMTGTQLRVASHHRPARRGCPERPPYVRFTPKSRHWLTAQRCPLCAKSRHHCGLEVEGASTL